ncbi:hypothetical protein [Brevibacillus borstelensis]|uniref:hypothetical protein n=1 Tax=Brevibacillus borstelensis TaxID=45462 RepID=UPI0030BF38BA
MWRTACAMVLLIGLLTGGPSAFAKEAGAGLSTDSVKMAVPMNHAGDSEVRKGTETADTFAAEQVELFDTDKERVVKTWENTTEFQAEAQSLLKSVSGRVLDLQPVLSHALIVKIPLAPPQKLTHKQAEIDAMIANMFVVMPKESGRRPWMILHTKEAETLVVEFSGQTGKLRKLLQLP